jgi:hypothetical protein
LGAFLRPFAERVMQILKLSKIIDFENFDNVIRVYLVTGGNPSYISKLFKDAIFCAMQAGRDEVGLSDFAVAYDNGVCEDTDLIHKNPFIMDSKEVLRRCNSLRGRK